LLLDTGQLKVRADIVFTRQRLAVFVDGCFWHACPQHGTTPITNTTYWSPKLQRNAERDRAVNAALTASGWQVVRIWAHEPVESACGTVIHALTMIEHTFDHSGSL
jgi:DNA mismatch endonuclease (patch repair protein)